MVILVKCGELCMISLLIDTGINRYMNSLHTHGHYYTKAEYV